LLAAAGFVLTGCGSGMHDTGPPRTRPHHTVPLTLAWTTTIAQMPTGTPIHCKHGPGAQVPPRGQGVTGNADGPNSSSEVQVTHRRDGSVVASCRSS
jgi:hypothetical protein